MCERESWLLVYLLEDCSVLKKSPWLYDHQTVSYRWTAQWEGTKNQTELEKKEAQWHYFVLYQHKQVLCTWSWFCPGNLVRMGPHSFAMAANCWGRKIQQLSSLWYQFCLVFRSLPLSCSTIAHCLVVIQSTGLFFRHWTVLQEVNQQPTLSLTHKLSMPMLTCKVHTFVSA